MLNEPVMVSVIRFFVYAAVYILLGIFFDTSQDMKVVIMICATCPVMAAVWIPNLLPFLEDKLKAR